MSHVAKALPFLLLWSFGCASRPAEPEEPATPQTPPAETPAETATPGAPQGGDQEAFLAQERERLALAEQKKAFLVEQHLANARGMMESLRLEEAEQELLRALELDADNLEVKRLLNEVGAMLGRSPAELQALSQDFSQRYQLRVQQLRVEAEDSLRRARFAMERGEYDAAIAELTIAKNHVQWAPASIDWGGMDAQINQLLEQARAERDVRASEQRLERERQTLEETRSQEEAERARRESLVDNLVDQAITAFNAGDFDQAIEHAEQALRKDPRNEQAADIRETAFRAGREQVRSDYLLAKREEFKRWQEQLLELRVPYTPIVTLPDQDEWNRITDLRSNRRGIDLSGIDTPVERELRSAVTTMRIPGLQVANEERLSAVVELLRTFTDLPLVVDPAAENAALDAGVQFNLNFPHPLTVQDALNIVTEQAGADVTWTIRHDAILVTTRTKARGEPIIYNHDVQDLIFGMTDFLGPRINKIRLLAEMEDDDGGGPFGGIGEKPKLIDIDALATMIQENVEPGSWEEPGISIATGEGYILVVHTPQVQARVRQFLNDLRRFSSSLVTIESRFMTVSRNWSQELGVDFRGLDNPNFPFKDLDDVTNGLEDMASRGLDNSGLGAASGNPSSGFFYDDGQDGAYKGRTENYFDNPLGSALTTVGGMTAQWTFLNDLEVSAILRAVEKSTAFQLVNSQVLSVHNTQRAYVSVVNQKAYIQDFDVEVAQFQAVADPQVNVLTEGIVLDVRPTIHYNRKYLTLEIQPTVANVVALRTFSSTLGGSTAPVEFQLPELEVQSVNTTALVPDGGSILLGGLSNIRNVERRAEVPWLAKIPVLGFFFKNEGYNDENKSLMILLRAHITDVNDEVKRLESTPR